MSVCTVDSYHRIHRGIISFRPLAAPKGPCGKSKSKGNSTICCLRDSALAEYPGGLIPEDFREPFPKAALAFPICNEQRQPAGRSEEAVSSRIMMS